MVNQAMVNINVAGASGAPVNAFDIFDQYTGVVNFRVKSDGSVWCRELTVELSTNAFPDFVFDDSYKLQSLKQREEYVIRNKRLPYMLSAKEVESNGASLTKVMTGILQNTEELTLYLFELNKKVEKLSMENAELKEKVNKLNSK